MNATEPLCKRCGGVFGRDLHTMQPPQCVVCWQAERLKAVLARLDAGERLLVLDVLPLSLPMLALRRGEESEYRDVQLDALALVAAGRWKLRPAGPRLSEVEKVELLRPGIVLALGEITDTQRYRQRRQWHEGVPADAFYRDAIRWVLARAIREARPELRNRAAQSLVPALPESDPSLPDPLEDLVRREEQGDSAALVARLWAACSEAERRLLEVLRSAPGLEASELAARVGVTPAYCRKLRERLRRRAARL